MNRFCNLKAERCPCREAALTCFAEEGETLPFALSQSSVLVDQLILAVLIHGGTWESLQGNTAQGGTYSSRAGTRLAQGIPHICRDLSGRRDTAVLHIALWVGFPVPVQRWLQLWGFTALLSWMKPAACENHCRWEIQLCLGLLDGSKRYNQNSPLTIAIESLQALKPSHGPAIHCKTEGTRGPLNKA